VEDFDFKLLSKVLRPNHEYSTLIKELENKKYFLSKTNISSEVMLNLLRTRRGMDIFRIARDLKQRKATFTSEDLKSALEQKIKHFDKLWEFVSNDVGRLNTELIREEKMSRTALTEAEAQDIFRIMSYTSGIRLFDLVKYEATSRKW
jgi:predicted nuclease with TOPRIM domain